jgi:hypothetical protein
VAVEPALQKSALVRWLEPSQGTPGQGGCPVPLLGGNQEGLQGQAMQLFGPVLLLGQPFGEGCDAGGGPGVKLLQHGHHLPSHPIAAEVGIGVAGVDPDRQPHLLADPSGVVPVKEEQRAHERHPRGQGAHGAEGRQTSAVAATRQIQENRFGPVCGGVGRQNVGAAKRFGLLLKALVAPAPSLRFRGRHRLRPLTVEAEALGVCPGGQSIGLGRGVRPPAMVAVPVDQRPAVERLQIPEQPSERHGVLTAGERHQQAGALWQEGRLAQEVPVQPGVVGSPAPGGRRGIGWENLSHNLACLQMSRHSSLPAPLQEAIGQRRLLKVIAGLTNRDQAAVEKIARAAAAGGADLLDLACDPSLVERIQGLVPGLPLCVSAVDPALFPPAVEAGASMVEIGNFDAFYAQGLRFEADEVLALTQCTRELLPEVVLSVTVPHVLPLDQQEQLAVALAHAGADWIQTEGGTSARPVSPGVLGLIEKSAPTLAATYAIRRALDAAGLTLPVLCASGLSAVTVPMALASGAAGVGVGSAVNRLSDEVAMVAVVRALREASTRSVAATELAAYGV